MSRKLADLGLCVLAVVVLAGVVFTMRTPAPNAAGAALASPSPSAAPDVPLTSLVLGPADATDLVLFMHGRNADRTIIQGPRLAGWTNALVDRGYLVASDDAGMNAWGNAASEAAYVALYRSLVVRYPVRKVIIVAESMGAVTALNALVHHDFPLAQAAILVSPVVDLARATSTPDLIQNALPSAYPTPSAIPTRDPLHLSLTSVRMPVTVYEATQDSLVLSALHAERLRGRLPNLTIKSCIGDHTAASCYRPGDAVAALQH